jgi:hypothetical protein
MYKNWLIICNKCTSLMENVSNSGKEKVCLWSWSTWEFCTSHSIFFYKSKNVPKQPKIKSAN